MTDEERPRALTDAFHDPDPDAWTAWINSPSLPDSTGLMWEPEEQLDDAGGHIWRGTRGPYSLCHRPSCRLAYSRWSGYDCPGRPAAPWRIDVPSVPPHITALEDVDGDVWLRSTVRADFWTLHSSVPVIPDAGYSLFELLPHGPLVEYPDPRKATT